MNKRLIAALLTTVFAVGATFATLSHAADKPASEKKEVPADKDKDKDKKEAPADKEKK